MKSAVVLRGFSFHLEYTSRGSCQKTYPIDFRFLYENYKENVFSTFSEYDLYLATYDAPPDFKKDVFKFFKDTPTEYSWLERDSCQAETLQRAIRMVRNEEYDQVIVTRFDVVWKRPLKTLKYNKELLNFPWKECNEAMWLDHRRAGDVVHIFPGKLLPIIQEAVVGYTGYGFDNLHCLWGYIADKVGESNMGFLFDGIYDSNPENGGPNPLYYIWRGCFRSDL